MFKREIHIILNMSNEYFSIELIRDELDRYFGGGIPKNTLLLFEGIDGAGKSILCQRFMYSLLKKGKKVTYISTEFNTLDFIKQMDSLSYSVNDYILNQHLLFITMVPFLGNVEFKDDFLEKIMLSKKIFENEIIIFDTLSFLLVKKNAGEEVYYKIINFFRKLNNLNKTIIFTIDPTHLDDQFLTLLRSVADMYMYINFTQFAGETVRALEIKRFKRPKDVYMSKIPFRVEPKEGLIIEIGSYA
jgi:flagellar protein FlaH